MSTFKVAGVSKLNGEFRVRFANDMTRVKVLAKNGHSDIDLIELKEPMTKEAAVEFLLSIDFDNGNALVRAALEAEVEKRKPAEPKAPRVKAAPKAAKSKDAPKKETKKPKAPKAETPTMEKIAARKPASTMTREQVVAQLDGMEESPF